MTVTHSASHPEDVAKCGSCVSYEYTIRNQNGSKSLKTKKPDCKVLSLAKICTRQKQKKNLNNFLFFSRVWVA